MMWPAHTSTTYDQGLNGLRATYYDNRDLAGKPTLFATGVGDATGKIDVDWGTTEPGGSSSSGSLSHLWSLRLSGLVTFPAAGDYYFQTNSDDGVRVWVNDDMILNQWIPQSDTADVTSSKVTVTASMLTQRIRVEYFNQSASVGTHATLRLKWKKPGDTAYSVVPGANLRPDYGLVTQSKVYDTTGGLAGAAAPSITSSTSYAFPWLGQATDTTIDPSGLALKTSQTFEAPGSSSWLRKLNRALPAANTVGAPSTAKSSYAYYTELEDAPLDGASPACALPAGTKQYGFLKSSTGPTPASGGAIVTQYVYDVMGRMVGTKTTGDTGWSCTTYDSRGRVTKQTTKGLTGTTALTTTTTFTPVYTATPAQAGMQVTVASGSPTGSITTVADLLGRTVSYTDGQGTVTTNAFEDKTGRLVSTSTTPAGGTASVTGFSYDADGKITGETVDGTPVVTNVTYTTGTAPDLNPQELASVTYAGGSKLNSITRNGAGQVTGQQWTFPSADTITDTAARSQAGRVMQEKITRGTDSYPSTYQYDAAGRLTSAAIPGHTLTYGFAATGGCGVNAAAGASGNRTSLTDVWTAPGGSAVTTSTSYCYDWADRLTSTSVTGAIPGANSVAAGVAASNIVYDAQGNVVRLADMLFSYDAAGLHSGTTYDDGSTVSVVRDASGRVVSRTVDPAGSAPAVTTKLLYSGDGDGAWAQLSGSTLTRQVGLPGGVMCTLTGSTRTFDYPSLLGHTLTTGDGVSTSAGVRLFDPYGQPLDPVTLAIGTTTADDQTNAQANSGWYGGALKLTETTGPTAVIDGRTTVRPRPRTVPGGRPGRRGRGQRLRLAHRPHRQERPQRKDECGCVGVLRSKRIRGPRKGSRGSADRGVHLQDSDLREEDETDSASKPYAVRRLGRLLSTPAADEDCRKSAPPRHHSALAGHRPRDESVAGQTSARAAIPVPRGRIGNRKDRGQRHLGPGVRSW
ncbi:MAG: hypothetical protein J0I62_06720 [Microbacterium sp.]|nr:hypothetical protein [Microbacterium sp.]